MDEVLPSIRLSLVIPCYNEATRAPLLEAGLESFASQWPARLEVILVNDGSTDDTQTHLQSIAGRLKPIADVRVIRQSNTGKGGALRTGVRATTGDWILTLDADMASPPTELMVWLKSLKGAFDRRTIYVGSREHPNSIIRKTGDRKLAGNIFNTIVRTITPLRLHDTQCGFKLYPGEAGRLLFEAMQTDGWAHDVDVLYCAQRHGARLYAMPLTWTAVDGSKISLLRDATRMLVEVVRISYLVRRRPLNRKLLSEFS